MPSSILTLCGSLAGTPFTFNVRVHNAAYRALGVDYTFVSASRKNKCTQGSPKWSSRSWVPWQSH